MSRQRVSGHLRAPPRWGRWVLPAAVLVIVVGAGYLGLRPAPEPGRSGGTPRLVVDRTAIDLGYVPFNTPARAVFTLTNAGDGPLRLTELPIVSVIAGC